MFRRLKERNEDTPPHPKKHKIINKTSRRSGGEKNTIRNLGDEKYSH